MLQVNGEVENVPSQFLLIPATQEAGVEYPYKIEIYGDQHFTINQIAQQGDWYETSIKDVFLACFGGDLQSEDFNQNPKFELIVSQNTVAYLLLQSPELNNVSQAQGLIVTDKDGTKVASKSHSSQSILMPLNLKPSGSPFTVVTYMSKSNDEDDKGDFQFSLTMFSECPTEIRKL